MGAGGDGRFLRGGGAGIGVGINSSSNSSISSSATGGLSSRLCHVQQFRAHAGKVLSLAWSPSGRFLATSGEDGIVKLWAVILDKGGLLQTAPVRTLEAGRGGGAVALTWSAGNTEFVAGACADGFARLWHPHTPHCLRQLPHPAMVASVAFHPTQPGLLLTGAVDGFVRLWKPTQKACVGIARAGSVVTAMNFSKDASRARAGTYNGEIIEYDLTVPEREHYKGSVLSAGKNMPTAVTSERRIARTSGYAPRKASRLESLLHMQDAMTSAAQLHELSRVKLASSTRRAAGGKIAGIAPVATDSNDGEGSIRACTTDARVIEIADDVHAQKQVRAQFKALLPRRATTAARLSECGRFLIADAAGEVFVVDFGDGLESCSTKKNLTRRKQKEVSVEAWNVLEKGNVSATAFANTETATVAGNNPQERLVAVGADDGSVRILLYVPRKCRS